ncbi:hypothetical protein GQ457_07G025640 [Hibiscus cannabinus]
MWFFSWTSISVVSMSKGKKHVYLIRLSPWIMGECNVKYNVISAIQRAMACIWFWDGDGESSALAHRWHGRIHMDDGWIWPPP